MFDADADEDGWHTEPYGKHTVADCDDNDPDVNPGAEEIPGNGKDDDCDPTTEDVVSVVHGTINIEAGKHTVGSDNHPESRKEAIAGMSIKVYDRHSSCVSSFRVSRQNYRSIWLSSGCVAEAFGVTDADGKVSLQVPPGDYIVIGFYDSDTYIGVSADGVESGKTTDKYLQVIEKADGNKETKEKKEK